MASKLFPTRFSFVKSEIRAVQTRKFQKEVRQIVRQIVARGQLDDRREYEVQDLEQMYGLERPQATELFQLIQSYFS